MGTHKSLPAGPQLVLVQLSDLHIGATWAAADPLAGLRACVAAVRHLPDQPDAIIVSGDLADHGTPEEYALIKSELADLGIPVHVVPGNHDDRRALRAAFGPPADDRAPVNYLAEIGPLRLFLLDSTIPDADHGELGRAQLDWLETSLADAPGQPALLVMHHPPFRTGVAAFDTLGLSEPARAELGQITVRHPQVCALLAGHFHRPMTACLGGRAALTAPSTYTQFVIGPAADEVRTADDEPPAFLVHRLIGDEFVSYVQPVAGGDRSWR